MSWLSVQHLTQELGFEVAFRMRNSMGGHLPANPLPAEEAHWMLAGSYDGMAEVWVRPRTEAARHLCRQHVADMLSDCDPYFDPATDHDAEYLAAHAPALAAARHREREWSLF